MVSEVPSSADWYNDTLQSEIRDLIPGILHDLEQSRTAGTLFAHDRFIQNEYSVQTSIEVSALLNLVEISGRTALPTGELHDAIDNAFWGALARKRMSNMGYAADGNEAEYILVTQNLGQALSFLETREWISPDPNINPRTDAYEGIVDYLASEGRIQEAERLIPLTDVSKKFRTDLVYALSANERLAQNIPIRWPEYKAQYVDRIGTKKTLGQFVVDAFIRREMQAGRMGDEEAIAIVEQYGDPGLILEIEADIALRSLQRGDMLGIAQYRFFQSWVSVFIKESFRRESLLDVNDINIDEQVYWLTHVAKRLHEIDKAFAEKLLVESRERAGLELVRVKRESLMLSAYDHEPMKPDLVPFLDVFKTALEMSNESVAKDVYAEMIDNGLIDEPDYCEKLALAWLPFDRKQSEMWYQHAWGKPDHVPMRYLLTLAHQQADVKDVISMVEERGRPDDRWSYIFWRKLTVVAAQKGDGVWKYTLSKLPVILRIFALRDLISAYQRDKMNLPKGSALDRYMWGHEDFER